MLDIVIESPVTKRVVRARADDFPIEVFARLVTEAQVGGLESAVAWLNANGTWARVAEFSDNGETFRLIEVAQS